MSSDLVCVLQFTVSPQMYFSQLKPRFVPPQQEKRIFTNFHRQLFCTIDKWVDLTMDDIRKMEAETQRELEEVSARMRDFVHNVSQMHRVQFNF